MWIDQKRELDSDSRAPPLNVRGVSANYVSRDVQDHTTARALAASLAEALAAIDPAARRSDLRRLEALADKCLELVKRSTGWDIERDVNGVVRRLLAGVPAGDTAALANTLSALEVATRTARPRELLAGRGFDVSVLRPLARETRPF